jgi:hypothetical protein
MRRSAPRFRLSMPASAGSRWMLSKWMLSRWMLPGPRPTEKHNLHRRFAGCRGAREPSMGHFTASPGPPRSDLPDAQFESPPAPLEPVLALPHRRDERRHPPPAKNPRPAFFRPPAKRRLLKRRLLRSRAVRAPAEWTLALKVTNSPARDGLDEDGLDDEERR